MAPIWNPRLVLGLRADDETEWRCVGTNPSAESGSPSRCERSIRPSELGKVNRLLAAMSHQMPDQIDHNELLHLARACLCADTPGPHRGRQEAAVIYQWTELMSAEACEMRVRGCRNLTDSDLGLPQSPRAAQTTFGTISSSPKLYSPQPKPKPARIASLQDQPRLITNLTPEKRRSGVFFPTPTAMDPAPTAKQDPDKWETETVISSPLSSLPFCFSPTTAKDLQKSNRRASTSTASQSPRSATLSGSPYSTPATTPSLTVHTPSITPSRAAHELPPSPPDSAVSPHAPISLGTHLLPPQSATTLELSPGDRIITTSLVIPAQHQDPNPLFHIPLTSPLASQKLEECSRLLAESQAENRILVQNVSDLRSELADLRREQASIQAGMVLLVYLIQAVSCFPLVVMEWVEAFCEVVFSTSSSSQTSRPEVKEQGARSDNGDQVMSGLGLTQTDLHLASRRKHSSAGNMGEVKEA